MIGLRQLLRRQDPEAARQLPALARMAPMGEAAPAGRVVLAGPAELTGMAGTYSLRGTQWPAAAAADAAEAAAPAGAGVQGHAAATGGGEAAAVLLCSMADMLRLLQLSGTAYYSAIYALAAMRQRWRTFGLGARAAHAGGGRM